MCINMFCGKGKYCVKVNVGFSCIGTLKTGAFDVQKRSKNFQNVPHRLV